MPHDAAQWLTLLLVMGMGVAVFVQLRRVLVRATQSSRETSHPVSAAPTPASAADPSPVRSAAAEKLEVELHEALREVQARIDTKLAALQTLCLLCERAADRLEAALTRAQQLGLTDRPDPLDAISRLAESARERDPSPSALASTAAVPSAAPPLLSPRLQHEVAVLAEQGLSPAAIAQRTATPQGDIELFLRLRPSGAA